MNLSGKISFGEEDIRKMVDKKLEDIENETKKTKNDIAEIKEKINVLNYEIRKEKNFLLRQKIRLNFYEEEEERATNEKQ